MAYGMSIMHTLGRLPGGTRTKSAYELLYARQSLVTHAKAFGLDAIDLVDIDYKGIRIVDLVRRPYAVYQCVLKFYVVLYNDLYQLVYTCSLVPSLPAFLALSQRLLMV